MLVLDERHRATFANRRLQPLGHLTADGKCVKSALAGSNFFLRTYNGFFNPPHVTNSSEKFAILCDHSGHTRREASRIRIMQRARVVRRCGLRKPVGRKERLATAVTADVGSLHRNAVDVALR